MGTDLGRIAYRGTKAVTEVTAVVQVLTRFVTESDPPVLMEELVPVAYLPHSGMKAATDPLELLRAAPAPLKWSHADAVEAATDALGCAQLDQLVAAAVESRKQALLKRQQDMANVSADWARGMDRVNVASQDLLTLTLLIPA